MRTVGVVLIASGALLIYWSFSKVPASGSSSSSSPPTSSSATPGSPQGAGLPVQA